MALHFNNFASMQGKIAETGRFVFLRHSVPETFQPVTGRGDHFDLMLEPSSEASLWTWAVEQNIFNADRKSFRCNADRLPDHRRVYLDFEGAVSGGRGTVKRVASGTFRLLESSVGLTLAIVAEQDSIAGELVLTPRKDSFWSLEFKPK